SAFLPSPLRRCSLLSIAYPGTVEPVRVLSVKEDEDTCQQISRDEIERDGHPRLVSRVEQDGDHRCRARGNEPTDLVGDRGAAIAHLRLEESRDEARGNRVDD